MVRFYLFPLDILNCCKLAWVCVAFGFILH